MVSYKMYYAACFGLPIRQTSSGSKTQREKLYMYEVSLRILMPDDGSLIGKLKHTA
jgi:hypothetical protein